MSDIKKVVLAYSGGLDTSVILKWLQDTYQCEVVTFTADLGQGEELEPARAKALQFGIKPEQIYIDDLREEFVRDFVFPMFRANTVYEGEYLLGTSIARPLIAKRLIEIVNETGADAISPRRHRQGQRPGALRTWRLCAEARRQGDRAVARVGSALAREAARLCRDPWHSDRHEAPQGRLAVFDGRQPAAHLLRRPPPGRPECRGRGRHVALDRVAGEGAGSGRVHRRSTTRRATWWRSTARKCARTRCWRS